MYALKSPIPQAMSNTDRNCVQFSGKIQQLIVFSNTVRSCAKKVLQHNSCGYTYLLPDVSQWVIGLGWDQVGFPVR